MDVLSLKSKIKEWERSFATVHGRKPSSDDIKASEQEIRDAYSNYWKAKKSDSRVKGDELQCDVWSKDLNMQHRTVLKKNSTTDGACNYESRIRNKILPTFTFNSKPHQRRIYVSEGNANESDHSQADAPVDRNQRAENDIVQSPTVISRPARTNVRSARTPSPVESVHSGRKAVYLKKSLDESWLSRNSQTDGDDDVFHSPASSSVSMCSLLGQNYASSKFRRSCVDSSNSDMFSSPPPREATSKVLGQITSPAQLSSRSLPSTTGDESLSRKDNHKILDEARERQYTRSKISLSADVRIAGPSDIPPRVIVTDKEHGECREVFTPNEVSEVSDEEELVTISKKRKRVATSKTRQMKKRAKLSAENGLALDSGDVETETRKAQRVKRSAKDALEKKVKMGTVNENFVRVNLNKKKFSRGHHKLNMRKFKYQNWKENKKKSAGGEKGTTCFKCGGAGHWARSCPGIKYEGFDSEDTDVPALPTLEEAAQMARGAKAEDLAAVSQVFSKKAETSEGSSGPDAAHDSCVPQLPQTPEHDDVPALEPFISTGPDGLVQDSPDIIYQTLQKMGFSEFRPGQEEAIVRILSGLSTLVLSSTGSGKSLCYQLPAYLYAQKYECITLVVSPLISLMEDQVVGLAPCLKAAFLHSAMPAAQKQQVVERIKARELHFVLVSPEMLTQSWSGGILDHLPRVAFACIDEAHCLSQWSHNFRPSYLRLYKILTTKLKVRCILALTATATESTCLAIASRLGIEDVSRGIIGRPCVPDNLVLSVSHEECRDEALIGLLKGDRLKNCESIIIYCTRREETERLATLTRISFRQEPARRVDDKKPKKHPVWDAEAYHAGMTPYRRRSIQKRFMTGKLRVVVATVAFGMGIDKADIRAIIHYNMPKSFESYVQEAGRAGRDGLTSYCHLFLEPQGNDENELKRHIYANSTDRRVLRKLLGKIFEPLNRRLRDADRKDLPVIAATYEVAIPIDTMVEELDLKEENIETLLCFLEFHPKKVLEVLNKVYSTCTIKFYGGPKQLRSVASKSAALAAAMALTQGTQKEDASSVTFCVVDMAAYMGWDSGLVKRELKRLEWDNSLQAGYRKTGVIVEFSELAFHLIVSTTLTEEDQDELLDYLHDRVKDQERTELLRLRQVHSCFESVAYESYLECIDSASLERSQKMKQIIRDYFSEKLQTDECYEGAVLREGEIGSLQQEIRALVNIHRDHKFNGRAVARIFHGIGSPRFPAEVWGRVRRFWRSHLHLDFNEILKVANQELAYL
ncbi:ATP-dependent DNA helicase Q4-like [Ornithodoros turicata]|uniref:ATP-dependent DNA helicase Q4-like n=1 Tax=Ornithodoros turicata TaxID=34597 RepID=UPI00313960DB